MSTTDLRLPRDHPFYKIIVYDLNAKQYYNKASDIYLEQDDISYHKLPDPSTLPGYKEQRNVDQSRST